MFSSGSQGILGTRPLSIQLIYIYPTAGVGVVWLRELNTFAYAQPLSVPLRSLALPAQHWTHTHTPLLEGGKKGLVMLTSS